MRGGFFQIFDIQHRKSKMIHNMSILISASPANIFPAICECLCSEG